MAGNERDDGLNRPATPIVCWPLLNDSYERRTFAYAVRSQRVGTSSFQREIGIRMALGAQSQGVRWLFVRHGLLLTGGGIVIGILSSLAVTRLMSTLLFELA